MEDQFGRGGHSVVAGLVAPFDGFPVHRLCYNHSSITAQEFRQCIARTKDLGPPLVDEFGMAPFHVLFSTAEPRQDLLEVLVEKYPYHIGILERKDANGKRPLDCLLSNWTETSASLL